MKAYVLLAVLLLVACTSLDANIVGHWQREDAVEVIELQSDGSFDSVLNGKRLTESFGGGFTSRYETDTSKTPHELYIIMANSERSDRIPMGIYKIEEDALIVAPAMKRLKSTSEGDVEVLGYDLPTSFTGALTIYRRRK